MAVPTRKGEPGDIEFDGEVTWVCLGGSRWTKHIERESEALYRRWDDDDLEKR